MSLFGVYSGSCTNNTDPEKLYRIKVNVPQVHGETGESDWAWPCVPPGWPSVLPNHTFTDKNDGTASTGDVARTLTHVLSRATPRPADGVWVMFEGGDETKPVWLGTWIKGT